MAAQCLPCWGLQQVSRDYSHVCRVELLNDVYMETNRPERCLILAYCMLHGLTYMNHVLYMDRPQSTAHTDNRL